MPAIATDEAAVYAALQVDMMVSYDEPYDADFIRSLIVAAEARVARFTGLTLAELDDVPAALTEAVIIDVATRYHQFGAELPETYWDAINPYRIWTFGAAEADED